MPTKHATITLTFGTDASGRPTMSVKNKNGSIRNVNYQGVFRTHLDAMRLFDVEMELRQSGAYMLPGGSISVWFPNMLTKQSDEWNNRFLANDTVIEVRIPSKLRRKAAVWSGQLYITFAKVNKAGYRFVGLFEEDDSAARPGVLVYKRRDNISSIVADSAITTI